jgi:protein-arginine kinase activator protein McsA
MYAGYVLLILAATGADETSQQGNTSQPTELRKFHEINADLRALFRREFQAKSESDRSAAIIEMTELYQELRRDPRLDTSDTLTTYKTKLWSRLTRIKADINKHISRAQRKRGSTQQTLSELTNVEQAQANLVVASTSGHLALAGSALGGPASVFSQGGARGGRPISDYGPSLVALIERTIAPEFWDTNGGPGTIIYYQPLMCLVVRATSEVHHLIGGATGALRAVGR